MLGAGMHVFAPPVLARRSRSRATASAARVTKKFDADHPRAALLKHAGLFAGWEDAHPKELASGKLVDFAAKRYAAMTPLHACLRDSL